MADSNDLVRLESELKTTEALQSPTAASMYQCNKWHIMGRDLSQENRHPDRRCPYFTKQVTKGSLHHLPQSVICIPTHFMQEYPDTFQRGNLITLQGPSGKIWKVRAAGKPILHSGWRAFAHDHDLREGDELCFTLTQPLHFVVDVLNRHGAVKQSALTATNTGKYTVASMCYPYEYVHRPRSRKGARKTSPTYHENFGYGVSPATIASRCKTTARDRGYPMGSKLGFSNERQQWKCREEKDGREVVTILDSDDDEAAEVETRVPDHVELSFGSAHVQNHRMSEKLVAHVKEQGEFVPQWSNPAPKVAMTVATQTIPAQEIAGHGEESKVAVKEKVDTPMVLHPEAAATELIICEKTVNQGHVSRDEDTMMSTKEEIETHLTTRLVQSDGVQLQIFTPKTILGTILCADSTEVLQSHTIPTTEHNSLELGPVTANPNLDTESRETLTSIAPGGDFLFETLQNIVDIPVIADTVNADPILPELAVTKNRELNESQESEVPSMLMMKILKPSDGNSGSKTSTTVCVLKSKRMQVAKLHRAKTLRAAQALTKKLRSPNFVVVMKSCNVYTDFTMDIPAEFGKKSRLPATEAKVTLVCDEVPTMCKAIWIGTNPEKPKLDAEAWMEFSRSHFLEEGDVCVFEIFNRVTIRIGIHIFRVVGLRRSLLPGHWTQHYNVVHLDAQPPSCAGATLPLPGSVE